MTNDTSAAAVPSTLGTMARPAQQTAPTGEQFTAGAGSETVNKPGDVRADDTAPIDMYLVRELRSTQQTVSRLIEGYLAVDEAHALCAVARQACEDDPLGDPRKLRTAVERFTEVNSQRRDLGDLHPDLGERLRNIAEQIEQLDRIFEDRTNPIYSAAEPQSERRQEFAHSVGQVLSRMFRQITELRGLCRSQGLTELEKVSSFVESIFYSTEQARQEGREKAAAALRQAFDGHAPSTLPTQVGHGAFRERDAPKAGAIPFRAASANSA